MTGFIAKKVLWTADPEAVSRDVAGATIQRPQVLFTGAGRDVVSAWLERHPWAGDLPLFSWHPVEGPSWARSLAGAMAGRFSGAMVRTFQDAGDGFWTVAGDLADVPVRFHQARGAPSERIDAVVASAVDVARGTRRPLAWEIGAEATGGLLAIGAAIAGGRAVAVSASDPGPLPPIAAQRHDVVLRAFLHRGHQAEAADA